jgi:hypothetical protein
MRRCLPSIALIACLLTTAPAAAEPVSGRYGTIDNQFTTTQPATAAGSSFYGRYHAPDDPSSDPPYMRKMTFHPPAGLRYDTSVPDRCTASDVELALRGPDACPPGSRLGGGKSTSKFMGEPQTVDLELFNNENEQIILARSPLVTTVARGRIEPDMSVTFASPTCWPTVGPAPCPVDTVLQIESRMTSPAYVRRSRAYMTTPPKCPKSGEWRGRVKFWWADGGEETIVTKQPCSRRPAKRTRRPS